MPNAVRTIDTYVPAADFSERHPGWTIQLADLPYRAREIFLPDLRRVLVDRRMHDRDPDRVVAHLVAHLDLHPIGGRFGRAQEEEAEMVAAIRLDRDPLAA